MQAPLGMTVRNHGVLGKAAPSNAPLQHIFMHVS
jgi:hypothetical protein